MQIYHRIKDLPANEQEPFKKWLTGQTCPYIPGVLDDEQDAYYQHDYQKWKKLKGKADPNWE